MAHIPLIHGPDGSKLSKRHGALGVDAYRAMGYLPAALRNYLVRLGWSHGDQEIFSTEEMIAAFDLPQIGRSPARFDFAKLENLNGHYIRSSADAELLDAIDQLLPHLADGAALAAKMTPALRQQLLAAMPSLKERAKTLLDIIDGAHFLFAGRPIAARRQGQGPAHRRRQGAAPRHHRRTRRSRALERGKYRTGGASFRRAKRLETWRLGAAVARRAHRPHNVARHFRSPGPARQSRYHGAASRPDGSALTGV